MTKNYLLIYSGFFDLNIISSHPCECLEAGGDEPGSDTAPHRGVVVPLDVLDDQLDQGVASPVGVRSR